jgi:predicted Rossmann-fold nucleotide-binding protein
MATLKTLCVYCGSKLGSEAGYTELAQTLGRRCAQQGVAIVFGGGRVGLMGALAEAAQNHRQVRLRVREGLAEGPVPGVIRQPLPQLAAAG